MLSAKVSQHTFIFKWYTRDLPNIQDSESIYKWKIFIRNTLHVYLPKIFILLETMCRPPAIECHICGCTAHVLCYTQNGHSTTYYTIFIASWLALGSQEGTINNTYVLLHNQQSAEYVHRWFSIFIRISAIFQIQIKKSVVGLGLA